MKIRKLFILLTFSIVLLLSACTTKTTPTDSTHTHTYSNEWSSDEDSHWHQATCKHNLKIDREQHSFDKGVVIKMPTYDTEGEMTYTCDVCKYEKIEKISKLIPEGNIISYSSTDVMGNVNLTEIGDLDWKHFESNSNRVQKKNSDYIGNTKIESVFNFSDYRGIISYTDGTERETNTGSSNGICSTNEIVISLKLDSNVKQIYIYTGAWNATNNVGIYNQKNELLAQAESFTAASTSINRVVTFAVELFAEKNVTVRIKANNGDTGNVSLVAVALSSNLKEYSKEFFVNDGSIVDPVNYDYSFAVIGDTQCMIQHAREFNSTANVEKIYNYVIDNAKTKNINHVFHLGDIVQYTWPNWGNTEEIKNNMYKEMEISYQQIGRMDGKLDYSLVRGNHEPDFLYDEYFGVNSTYTNYGSHIEEYYINSTNSIHYFSAGNLDYMVVTLDFGAGDLVLNWANERIAAHPNHNVIITTHAYMHIDGQLLNDNHGVSPYRNGANDPLYNTAMGETANNGDDMWNKLIKKHSNIVLVLCGHDSTEDVVVTQLKGDNGNIVTNMLIDPQAMDTKYKSQGGVGGVAMFYFSNGGKDVEVRYWSTVQNAYIKTSNQYKITLNVIERNN